MRTPRDSNQPPVPSAATGLLLLALVLCLLAGLALLTEQPQALVSLAAGTALGLLLATGVVLGEVRKLQHWD